MNFFDQCDLRLKGMVMEVSESHSKLGQVLEMVGVMSIQLAKGASMVCHQCLVPDYWHGWAFNHGDVFVRIHGIQMHMDHWNFRAILSWIALLFTDGTRWDLSWFYDGFGVLSPSPFGLGWCRCGCSGWLMRIEWGVRLNQNRLHRS